MKPIKMYIVFVLAMLLGSVAYASTINTVEGRIMVVSAAGVVTTYKSDALYNSVQECQDAGRKALPTLMAPDTVGVLIDCAAVGVDA